MLDHYMTQVNDLMRSLNRATGLSWEYEETGGGCAILATLDDTGRLICINDEYAGVPYEQRAEWNISVFPSDDYTNDLIAAVTVADIDSCVIALQKFQADEVIRYEHVLIGR